MYFDHDCSMRFTGPLLTSSTTDRLRLLKSVLGSYYAVRAVFSPSSPKGIAHSLHTLPARLYRSDVSLVSPFKLSLP